MGEMGESVLVVGDESLIRVHVHTPRPDRVLAYALDIGRVEDVSVQNLDQQVRSVASERKRDQSPVLSSDWGLLIVDCFNVLESLVLPLVGPRL